MTQDSAQLDFFKPVAGRKFRRGEFKHLAFVGPCRRGCLNVPAPDPTSSVSQTRGLYVQVTRKVSPKNGTDTGPRGRS